MPMIVAAALSISSATSLSLDCDGKLDVEHCQSMQACHTYMLFRTSLGECAAHVDFGPSLCLLQNSWDPIFSDRAGCSLVSSQDRFLNHMSQCNGHRRHNCTGTESVERPSVDLAG